VLGARSSDSSLMLQNLKRAAQLDGSLGNKAKGDLEFRNYKSSAEFGTAVSGN
jgi:hypothetical protein